MLTEELAGDSESFPNRLVELHRLRISETNPNQACTVIAVLLRHAIDQHRGSPKFKQLLNELQNAWKLSNEQTKSVGWIVDAMPILLNADQRKWSEVQPWLIHNDAVAALDVIEAVGDRVDDQYLAGVEFARTKLKLPEKELNPEPFITGRDLIEMEVRPGPQFKSILQSIRDGQLNGEILSRDEALDLMTRLARG